MKEQKENRRVRMTKQLMKDALLELMEERELGAISVTAICEVADVHRSTFYKYYNDPAALLKEVEQDYLETIPLPPTVLDPQNQELLLTETTAFFDNVKLHKNVWRVLLSETASNRFTMNLVEYLCSQFIPVSEYSDETSRRFIRLYIANGTVGMLREWINADFPVSSREIAEMMYYYSRKLAS